MFQESAGSRTDRLSCSRNSAKCEVWRDRELTICAPSIWSSAEFSTSHWGIGALELRGCVPRSSNCLSAEELRFETPFKILRERSMIQRRTKAAEHELPLTTADMTNSCSDKSKRKRMLKTANSPALLFQALGAAVILIYGLNALSHHLKGRRIKHHHHHHHPGHHDNEAQQKQALHHHHAHEPRRVHPKEGERHLHRVAKGELPLEKYPSLSDAFAKCEIVALYFAASWCGMSSPITEALDDAFSGKRNTLLYPDEAEQYDAAVSGRKPLSIVYVSSDRDADEMSEYLRGGWLSVPFDSVERTELKKHFRVCAKRELEELGFERKFEIPTLIILDGLTHGVISTHGVDDIKEHGDKSLQHWLGMQSLIRGLEEKYEDEALKANPEPRIV